MSKYAIELCGVGKRYWKIKERSLLRSLSPFGGPNRTPFWALSETDLCVEPGETVGIIGRNGAGKSTMMRLLAGVTRPSTGKVITRGRVAPLLSVGVGFHHEMTGRENIYVNGMLLGLGKQQIDEVFDQIVDFAQLNEFIDTPVKFYSSGMYMRLGFSVAIHVEPEVLLVDEVLAVGDVGFQIRCFDRMRELQASGTAIVFVSHWLQLVQQLCPRAIFLTGGRVAFDGPVDGAIAAYHTGIHDPLIGDSEAAVRVVDRALVSVDGAPIESARQDVRLIYRVRLRFEQAINSPHVLFQIYGEDGTLLYQTTTSLGDAWRAFAAGEEVDVSIHFLPRFGGGGTFRPVLVVTDTGVSETYLRDDSGPMFFVEARVGVAGVSDLDGVIFIDEEDVTDRRPRRFGSSREAIADEHAS